MNHLHFAIVVGINCYPNIARQLSAARDDAEAFAGWLKDPDGGGVPPEQVELITASPTEERTFVDSGETRPVRQEVINALRRFHKMVRKVDDRSWPETRLYLYVAGHGIAPSGGRGALLYADADPPDYADNLDLAKYDELYGTKSTPFHEVVLLADCCRETALGLPDAGAVPFGKTEIRGQTRRILAYATTYSKMAGAPKRMIGPKDHGRGFFTEALLAGLRGGAAHDPETGAIRSDHLKDYLYESVRNRAAALNYKQRADLQLSGPGQIDLAYVPVQRYRVEFRVPKRWNDDVLVTQGDSQTVRHAPVDDGVAVIDLRNGIYKATEGSGRSRFFQVDGGELTIEI
ncbi:hypothetical protein DMA12_18340 [Amycolatopsis balhimycina DSM 5908]|uniref:Peptidase C14 caspase domain-containing protein n=1 Tax=Amycolatopsis balhimycina DSM 5908 TaxID=1081091 RepID=A0A428WL70_AMYBA|nr:caspase family protein [Amycolatopsis balhimycina]RSM43827.1 hypothetical protein DMA12_18340 [Amycolatopsis balhimycina DSM 5908]